MKHKQTNNPVQDTIPAKKKKKRGCCFGCSIILVLLFAFVLGVIGYYVYESFPKKSAVEKEYEKIPDYFQP